MVEECQQMFEELKSYLNLSPLLTKSKLDEELYLYLIVFSMAISSVLVRQEEKTQKLIYYIRKTLHDVKTS